MASDIITKKLTAWIDRAVIAEAIIEDLEDEGLEVTLELAQNCWEAFLMCELHHGLKTRVDVLVEKQSESEYLEGLK